MNTGADGKTNQTLTSDFRLKSMVNMVELNGSCHGGFLKRRETGLWINAFLIWGSWSNLFAHLAYGLLLSFLPLPAFTMGSLEERSRTVQERTFCKWLVSALDCFIFLDCRSTISKAQHQAGGERIPSNELARERSIGRSTADSTNGIHTRWLVFAILTLLSRRSWVGRISLFVDVTHRAQEILHWVVTIRTRECEYKRQRT